MSTGTLKPVSPTTAELLAHFAPLIEHIGAGAVHREAARQVPAAEIRELFTAGIGRLRIPVQDGGFGASLRQNTELLIELAAADSNIVQALHGHQGFVENILVNENPAVRQSWFPRLVDGAILGDAQAEKSGVRSTWNTVFTRHQDGRITVRGEKFYTTGTLYADWALIGGADTAGNKLTALVELDQPAITVRDDWNGFGQKLSGSGSASFHDALIEPENLFEADPNWHKKHIQAVMYQHNLHTALAGIARAVLRDALNYVKSRTRNLANPALTVTDDPVTRQVIGTLAGISRTVDAAVLCAADLLDVAANALARGEEAAELITAADTQVYATQPVIIDLVLKATSTLFDVGGASAVITEKQLDRHWRNARVIANHNSATHRSAMIGQYLLGGATPTEQFLASFALAPPADYAENTATAETATLKEQP